MFCENCGVEIRNPNQPFCLKCRNSLIKVDEELQELLDSGNVRIFVDGARHRVWIWKGSNIVARKKFKSFKIAPSIRDRQGIRYEIVSVNEGNEPSEFLEFIQGK